MLDRQLIWRDPEIMGGVAVFAGTRVPVSTMVDYLEGDQPLADFLDDFPSVQRDHALAVLRLLQGSVTERTSESLTR